MEKPKASTVEAESPTQCAEGSDKVGACSVR